MGPGNIWSGLALMIPKSYDIWLTFTLSYNRCTATNYDMIPRLIRYNWISGRWGRSWFQPGPSRVVHRCHPGRLTSFLEHFALWNLLSRWFVSETRRLKDQSWQANPISFNLHFLPLQQRSSARVRDFTRCVPCFLLLPTTSQCLCNHLCERFGASNSLDAAASFPLIQISYPHGC